MKSILATLGLLALLWSYAPAQSQPAKPIPSATTNSQIFDKVDLFEPSQQDNYELSRQLSAYGLLELDEEALAQALHRSPEQLQLILPAAGSSQEITLELIRVEVAASSFSSVQASTGKPFLHETGLHYRGTIKGEEGSVAALSLFEGQVMGLFSSAARGNLVLGALSREQYVLYEGEEVLKQLPFDCATPDEGPAYSRAQLQAAGTARTMSDCIGIYLEVDYDVYQSKGGAAGATNYITGLFNQVATLYANESISIKLSEIYLWDVPSPYAGTSSYNLLTQFVNNRPSFNGDLGQLVSYQASGGIAYLSGLCNPYSPKHSFSSINASYASVPTYSFSVMVMAHELGHLFGARHTHACAWNGNGTALDACPGYTEGDCPPPANPSNGGTIMSYCHISSVGINFSKGFGVQPGNLIRNAANAAACLQPCGSGGGGDDPPPAGGDGCDSNELAFALTLDIYGSETRWELRDSNEAILYSGGPYPNMVNGTLVADTFCLPDGCYTFQITDSFGDGICCAYGNGSYSLVDTSGAVIASGGRFGSGEMAGFCLPLNHEPEPDSCLVIDFNDYEVISFGGLQDAGYAQLYDNGQILKIGGNAWKAIELDYKVKPQTVIELEFGSTIQGEIHGIGFDSNNSISANRTFRLFGFQNWGFGNYDNYPGIGVWRRYVIPIGEFYTGEFNRLFFVADHDGYPRSGNSYFRNIRIYERAGCGDVEQLPGPELALLEQDNTPAALEVFPNPARDRITLNFLSPHAGQAHIQAFSLTGQLVLERELGVLPGAYRETLNVAGLTSGTYVLKVLVGGEQMVKKFSVIHY